MDNRKTAFLTCATLLALIHGSVMAEAPNKFGNRASQKKAESKSKEDTLAYVGRDADMTGAEGKPDGINDTHLQLVHVFEDGEQLDQVEVGWASNPEQVEKQSTGWVSKSNTWRVIVAADGKSLNDESPSLEGARNLKGKVRLDVYAPYTNERYESKGSSYSIRISIYDAAKIMKQVSSSIIVK